MLTTFLLAQIRPYRRGVGALAVLQVVQTALTLLLPALNAEIINKGIVRGEVDFILRLGGFMIIAALVQVICQVAAIHFSAQAAMAVGRDLRSKLFRRIQGLSERDVGQFGASSLVTRSVNDVDQVQNVTIAIFDVAVPAPIMCVGAFCMALFLDVPLSLLLVGVMVVIAVALNVILWRMAPWYSRMQKCLDKINQIVREQINGVQIVRAFVTGQRERERFSQVNSELRDHSTRVGMLIAIIPPVILLSMNGFSVLLLWLGSGRIDSGQMEAGTLAALLSYMGLCVMSVTMALLTFLNVPRARVSAIRIREVLDTATSVPAPSKAANEPIAAGRVELRSVTFTYPGANEPVVNDVNLTAMPGELVGIVGSTGSGKTTLLGLVLRLFDATGGAVLVNGVDVRLIDADVLPRTVALVPQTPYLFSGSIESNLRFGRPESTDAELWHALEVAQAREFVEGLADGLRTTIDQGGSALSGGQRQRLAIARALLCRANIYLLDDCFSELDFATAAAAEATLAAELSTETVLMVAQRVSAVRRADRIIVLDEGRIVGTGSHAYLMQTSETYRDIAQSELAGMGAL